MDHAWPRSSGPVAAANTRRVAVASGDGQSAVIGTTLMVPLVAALLDPSGQPLAGQPLFFRVRGNNGSLDGGVRGLQGTTDSTGRAAAHFTLGTRAGAGDQTVEAFSPGYARRTSKTAARPCTSSTSGIPAPGTLPI
jgi:hypothetical protein